MYLCVCVYDCRHNKDMKQLITLLNTTLQAVKAAKPGRQDSASDKAPPSSVAAAQNDTSDVAVVRPRIADLGVTFVKESPSVLAVPPAEPHPHQSDDDSLSCASEPRFQLGAFFFQLLHSFTVMKLAPLDCRTIVKKVTGIKVAWSVGGCSSPLPRP